MFIILISLFAPTTANFAVVGDWGCPECVSTRVVANTLHDINLDFVISVGDNFYPNGIESPTDDLAQSWSTIFEPQIPWYLVLGNHDYYGNTDAQLEMTNIYPYWNMPSRYYTTVLDDIQFWFLDTTPLLDRNIFEFHETGSETLVEVLYGQRMDTEAQYEWLETTLNNSLVSRKIFVGHHPLWTFGNIDVIEKNIFKPRILSFMRQYSVESYLCGHDHSLQHINQRSVQQFISGSGGFTYDFDKMPLLQEARLNFRSAENGFLVVDGKNYTFYSSAGTRLYTSTI